MAPIKGEPTPGLCYNPNNSVYWDHKALDGELERVFEICHGCRLCFNLCPSFPALFRSVDSHDGDVRKLNANQINEVIDLCYQCKLCYVKCPYTPDDKHEFQLDFPRLMLRANFIRKKEDAGDLRSQLRSAMLTRPNLVGEIGGMTAGVANWANKQPLLRFGMELTTGIHRDKMLPDFFPESFESWYVQQGRPAGDPGKAVLFHTCFVNHNNPELGKDVIEVYSRNGISLGCPKQNCCGMPSMEAGDIELAKSMAKQNVESLFPYVNDGRKVVAINPTCSYMMRKEYPELLGTPEAQAVAASTMDVSEFLWQRKVAGELNRDFLSTPGKVAYHVPCHLKAQNIGFRSRDIMRLIPGTQIRMVEQCSGHDGTWAMKKEFFPLSLLAGKKAFDEMKEAEAETMATDCPLAAIQFDQAIGTRPIHPLQVVARAYRSDGFPTPVETPKKES